MFRTIHNGFLVLSLAVWLAGCAFEPTYHASANSAEEGATVSGMFQMMPFFKVAIVGVDRYVRRGMDAGLASPMLIDPGIRNLKVRCEYLGFSVLAYKGESSLDLRADLKAGHAYELKGERSERHVTVWLEDAATHQVVSQRVSAEATVAPVLGGVGSTF